MHARVSYAAYIAFLVLCYDLCLNVFNLFSFIYKERYKPVAQAV